MSFVGKADISEFPSLHLCPKNETGVLNFLTKNPDLDGRGTVVAVFDTGVDPGAPGLKVTSTGLPKVIERFDCSGAGDVDTSTVVTADETGVITGLSGRKLTIPPTWKNPTGQYRVGVKPVFDLYTPKVKERMEAKRKEEFWDSKHRLIMAEANRKLTKDQTAANNNKTPETPSPLEKLEKEEGEAQLEVLQTLEKKFKDLGPLLDCVVWNDGTEWRASLCSDGNLESSIVLGEFTKRQEFAPLSKADQMNVSVNVHDNGNILEIVGLCGSHGTHVASIATGCFPEDTSLNGVAPGAQVMSFTIGDGRLNSMETGTSLVRAMAYVMQNAHRIHVINMSYGELGRWSTTGRIGELMKEVVDKFGVTWVVSGGNHGPALSTVGTPPWLNANVLIGVGAYVSPEMMSAEYSLRQKLPGMPYSWSSRGPTLDGDMGVSICAPGGAITSVPNFTLRSAQLMNGTSMAAPHVAGCVAILLSGAVKKGLQVSPYSVKKALEHSAHFLPGVEPFAQGHGLVQIDKAFQVLEELSTLPERDVRYNVSVSPVQGGGSGWPMKSIYIRDPPLDTSKEYTINVEPVFFKDDVVEPEEKINFRMNLCLLSSVPWVHVPKFFNLPNMQRSFNAKVDVQGLTKGVHWGKIEAFDASGLERGPVFTIFVTAIVPEVLPVTPLSRPVFNFPTVVYDPGAIKRYFFQVPKGASWAVMNFKLGETPGIRPSDSSSSNATARFIIHCVELHPGQSCKGIEYYKMITLNPHEEVSTPFKVTEGKVVEVVVARWWSEPVDQASLSGTLTFRSLSVNKPEVVISAADLHQKLKITNGFGMEEVQTAASLKHQVTLLRPSECRIVSLPEPRDMIPPSRVIYQLENTYNFSISKATEITVNNCLLGETLYESEYESQMWQLHNKFKQWVGGGDAYPSRWPIKVEKGDYVLRLHVRHEKREALEKLMNGNTGGANGTTTSTSSSTTAWSGDSHIPGLPMLLSTKLPTAITLDVYQHQHELQDFKGSKKGTGWSTVLKRDNSLNVFLSTVITDKNLKTLPVSSTLYLQGSLTVHKDEVGKKLVSIPIKVILPDTPPKPKTPPTKDPSKTKVDEMADQLRDLQINWIPKLENEESKKLYDKLIEAGHDAHLPLHLARLQFLDSGNGSGSSNTDPASGSSGNDGNSNEATGNQSPKSSTSGVDIEGSSSPSGAGGNGGGAGAGGKKPAKTPEMCREIITISDKILGMVDQPALLAFIGNRSGSQIDNGKFKQTMDKQKNALTDALMKKGLAMVELLKMSEDGKTPDPGVTIGQIDEVLFDLQKYLDITDPRVLDFAYGHAMARKHHCRALRLLFKYTEDQGKWTAEIDKKFLEAFKALDWTHCVWYFEGLGLVRYPTQYRPF